MVTRQQVGFILLVFSYIAYIFSMCRFCGKYLGSYRYSQKIFAFLVFLSGIFINAINIKTAIPYIFAVMSAHILFAFLIFTVSKDSIAKKLFITLVLITVKTLVWNFGSSFFSCFVLLSNMLIYGQTNDILIKMENIIVVFSYWLVIFVLNILNKKSGSVFNSKIENWYFIMSAPLAFVVIITDIANWAASNGIMVVSDANGAKYWNVYYNQIFSNISICILTLLSLFIASGFVSGMNKIYTEQKQKEWYYAQKEFYKMLNKQYLQMDRLRHDMKNHVVSLYGLWESKEYGKIGHYLENMLEAGNICTGGEATGNKVIDILLYNKKKQAEQNKIRIEADIIIPGNCIIDEFDLCVLFGNILDNAINSCSKIQDTKYKFIDIKSLKVKKFFLLTVKNGTMLKNIKEIKQKTGFYNINKTVKKYNGVVNIKAGNNVFEISVLLPVYKTDIT